MWVALLPAAYLLGTFPSAALVASASGVDITATGSGNPGASNVTRALGWRKGLAVFVLDALKGAVATLIGLWLGGRAGGYAFGAAAIVGHIFPVTRGFRGGKGVATGGGVLAVLHPIVAAVVAAVWLALSRLTGKAAVASIAAVAITPVGLALAGAPAWEFAATLGLCALLSVRHAGNIRRLLRGEEHTLVRR
jgi:glycerol-3-phosphate acyltransferase PlsY